MGDSLNPQPGVPDHVKAMINEGMALRGSIVNAYAQIEYLLGDLIIRSREFVEYEEVCREFTHRATKRVAKVRSILELQGPLSPFATELEEVLEGFQGDGKNRQLFVHGFAEFILAKRGESGFRFRKFHRAPDRDDARLVRTLRLSDFRKEAEEAARKVNVALALFIRIHHQLGWGTLNPEDATAGL